MDIALLRPIFWAMLETTYLSVIILMFLDNTILPIPGETFLLFAGYLIYLGQMNYWLVVLACATGSVLGSALGYELGRKYGEPLLEKYGKYVLLSKKHMHAAKRWFEKKGPITVLYSRFVPGVGHLISVPAGAAKMNRWLFLLYSFAAALVWYGIVTYICLLVGRQWDKFGEIMQPLQLILFIIVVITIAVFVVRKLHRKHGSAADD